MTIKQPTMVYKIYEQKTIFEDRPGAGYDRVVDVLVGECVKSEQILDYMHFDKYYKVKYELASDLKE